MEHNEHKQQPKPHLYIHTVLPGSYGGYVVWLLDEFDNPDTYIRGFMKREDAEALVEKLNGALGSVPRYPVETD